MSAGWLWTGSSFAPAHGVPLTDRGFRYGMSVFESFPVRGGIASFLPEHLQRLRQNCARVGFTLDERALESVAGLMTEDGFGRIYVSAGDGPVTGEFEHTRVWFFIEPREPVAARVYHGGYNLGIDPRPHLPLFGGSKTGNYWSNLAAFREGVAGQCNETLLVNPEGRVISACMANVFAVFDGQLKTPPLGDGARDGVIRQWVICRREVAEVSLSVADLAGADEIFLTSSWLGVMPAASLEARPLPSRSAGKALQAELASLT